VLRTPITLTAAALAAALALTACGNVQLGAAAVTHTSRIPTATVSAEVTNLDAAYQADKAKVQLQFPASQMPQQVLSWLVRFRVREQMAARNHLTITRAETQSALASASAQAKQSGVTLTDLAVANGIPPDQINELGRYVAIQNQLLDRLDGGTLPTASAALQTLGNRFNTYQCRAAKSMGIRVNPQFGRLDYSQVSVIPAPPELAAAPHSASPSPSASPTPSPQLTPAC
jgi:peptidyl-prolyl cis-trans isomerase SurA